MEIFVYIIVGIIGLIAIIGIIHVTNYNRIQSKQVRINEAEGVIDETLRNRYDLLIKISGLIKTNVEIKNDYFKELETLNNKQISNFDFDRKLKENANLVYQLLRDNSSLEDKREITEILKDLKISEERLEASKNFYNKYTTELNKIIKKFPSNITARIHGFVPKTFFDGKNLEDNIVDDFKV